MIVDVHTISGVMELCTPAVVMKFEARSSDPAALRNNESICEGRDGEEVVCLQSDTGSFLTREVLLTSSLSSLST